MKTDLVMSGQSHTGMPRIMSLIRSMTCSLCDLLNVRSNFPLRNELKYNLFQRPKTTRRIIINEF